MDSTLNIQKTSLGYRYKVSCTTISPVHIGGSSSLSPLSDYYIENNRLYLVDGDMLADILEKKNQIEPYLAMVRRGGAANDEQKSELLKKFLNNNLKIKLSESGSNISYPVYIKGNAVEVQEFIKTDGYHYIPGSSIKGAIRTAMLFEWLENEKDNKAKQALTHWKTKLNELFYSNLRSNKKALILEKEFNDNVEEKFFGNIKQDGRLAMSCLRLSDSDVIKPECISIYEIIRFNLATGNDDIPVIKECVENSTTCSFEINLNFDKMIPDLGEKYSPILDAYTDHQKLCDTLNHYSKSVLKYEIEVLQSELVDRKAFEKYEYWLRDLLEKIENVGNFCAYIRLGAGKLQFYQTIAMILFKHAGEDEKNYEWIKYLRYCNNFPEKGVSNPYPITRALTSIGQIPLGWVKLIFNK